MGRRKKFPIEPWLTATHSGSEPGGFVRVGKSLFQSPKFHKILKSARFTYLCMCMEAGGKKEFTFPRETMLSYGLEPKQCRKDIARLEEAGLIRKTVRGKGNFHPNEYEFLSLWKPGGIYGKE